MRAPSPRQLIRKCRRLLLIVATILGETAFLNLTVSRKPSREQLRYRSARQAAACRRVLRIWAIDVSTRGAETNSEPALIVSNHLGVADTFVIASTFPISVSGKAELLRVPVVGWICKSISMIPVFRQRRLLSAEFAAAVADHLDEGVNVLVFPEGTTVPGTDVMPFKTGGFAAVEKTPGRQVVPIALVVREINGQVPDARGYSLFTWTDPDQSLLSHLWNLLGIESARIEIVIGNRISADNLDRKELAGRSHQVVAAASKSLRLRADIEQRG